MTTRPSSFQSDGFADHNVAVNTSGTDQTFAYKLGATGETISFTVTDGTTLGQRAGLINDAANNPGVTATVIDDGAESNTTRLVLQAKNSGENNRITLVTPLPDITFTEIQGNSASLSAELKVNGITYERQSNTGISDIIHGITLNLNQTGTTTIQVHNDTSPVQTDLMALIDSMNKAFQDITAKSAYDQETGTFGPLGSATSLKSLRGQLMDLLSTRVTPGGTVTSLFDLGFAINRDGTVRLDEAKVTAALEANLEDVAKLFVGEPESGITGLADLLNNKLRDVTKPMGFIDTEKQASESELRRLQDNIAETTTRLDQRFEILTRQFAALDSFASQMQSQADFLRDMMASFNQDS